MKKVLALTSLLLLLLSACGAVTPVPTATQTVSPTQTVRPTYTRPPTRTPFPTSAATREPTITAPPPSNIIDLPPNWSLIEFRDGWYWDVTRRYSSEFPYQPYNYQEHVINGQSLQTHVTHQSDNDGQVHTAVEVSLGNIQMLVADCGLLHSDIPTRLTWVENSWTFDGHWIVELTCNQRMDIIFDGQFLDDAYGYSHSFLPRLISGKLFYFFTRDDQAGFYFDGEEYALEYNDISYAYCCGMAEINPQFAENFVLFMAIQGEEMFPVVLGILDSP